jgi:hypothetical protein
LILPLIAIFLLVTVNNRDLMQDSINRLPGNMLMTTVVFITLIIGLSGIARAIVTGFGFEFQDWNLVLLAIAIASFAIVGIALLKISGNSN